MEALAEAIRIGREANLPVEVFHLKVSGKARWGNMKQVVATIQAARDSGLDIAASMYPYTAGARHLPPPFRRGSPTAAQQKLLARLKDPAVRARIKKELAGDHPNWENLYLRLRRRRSGILLASIETPELKQFEGKTVEDVAKVWNKSPEDTLMDFVIADSAQTGALYFMASEEDIHTGLAQRWTSIGLDANEMSLDGPIFEPHTHPRAFGSMPRFLGHYVRDEHLMPLEAGIRKTHFVPRPARAPRKSRHLEAGYFADITDLRSRDDHRQRHLS